MLPDDAPVIVGGPGAVDDRLFPGSAASVETFREVARIASAETGAVFVDTRHLLDEWGEFFEDHLHPNHAGHRRIAEAVLTTLPTRGASGG